MANIETSRTDFVLQAAGTEIKWKMSWLLTVEEWFNFQLVPRMNRLSEPDGQIMPAKLEITGQGVAVTGVGQDFLTPWLTIRNLDPGGHAHFAFSAARGVID